MKTELTNTTTKLDLGETSSVCPSKMGEGRDGPSNCPLPKVLVRSEEESQKTDLNKPTSKEDVETLTLTLTLTLNF